MSYSSLWAIDRDLRGEEVAEFQNSWLFSPKLWRYLEDKYSAPISVMGGGADYINRRVMNGNDLGDKIAWGLSVHCAFRTSDAEVITEELSNLDVGEVFNGRVQEILAEINALDPVSTPYFVLKGTSVDDNVERLFIEHDEDGEPTRVSLKDYKRTVINFVSIVNGGVIITGNENI